MQGYFIMIDTNKHWSGYSSQLLTNSHKKQFQVILLDSPKEPLILQHDKLSMLQVVLLIKKYHIDKTNNGKINPKIANQIMNDIELYLRDDEGNPYLEDVRNKMQDKIQFKNLGCNQRESMYAIFLLISRHDSSYNISHPLEKLEALIAALTEDMESQLKKNNGQQNQILSAYNNDIHDKIQALLNNTKTHSQYFARLNHEPKNQQSVPKPTMEQINDCLKIPNKGEVITLSAFIDDVKECDVQLKKLEYALSIVEAKVKVPPTEERLYHLDDTLDTQAKLAHNKHYSIKEIKDAIAKLKSQMKQLHKFAEKQLDKLCDDANIGPWLKWCEIYKVGKLLGSNRERAIDKLIAISEILSPNEKLIHNNDQQQDEDDNSINYHPYVIALHQERQEIFINQLPNIIKKLTKMSKEQRFLDENFGNNGYLIPNKQQVLDDMQNTLDTYKIKTLAETSKESTQDKNVETDGAEPYVELYRKILDQKEDPNITIMVVPSYNKENDSQLVYPYSNLTKNNVLPEGGGDGANIRIDSENKTIEIRVTDQPSKVEDANLKGTKGFDGLRQYYYGAKNLYKTKDNELDTKITEWGFLNPASVVTVDFKEQVYILEKNGQDCSPGFIMEDGSVVNLSTGAYYYLDSMTDKAYTERSQKFIQDYSINVPRDIEYQSGTIFQKIATVIINSDKTHKDKERVKLLIELNKFADKMAEDCTLKPDYQNPSAPAFKFTLSEDDKKELGITHIINTTDGIWDNINTSLQQKWLKNMVEKLAKNETLTPDDYFGLQDTKEDDAVLVLVPSLSDPKFSILLFGKDFDIGDDYNIVDDPQK